MGRRSKAESGNAESLVPSPSGGVSDLAGVADRAGAVVREQIESMVDAARASAGEIERRASDSADATRRDGLDRGMQALKTMNALEGELTSLLREVSKEADGLRTKLERRRLLSASRGRPGGPPVVEAHTSGGDLGLLAQGAAPALEEAEAPSHDPPAQQAAEPAEPREQDPVEATADETAPAAPDDAPVETADDEPPEEAQPPAPAAAQAGSTPLDEEARTAVAQTMSDVELAELYALASVRVVEKADDEQEASYWSALLRATVDEAVSRPDFGRPGEDEHIGGRRKRRQRQKLLEPLVAAREDALGGSAGS